MPVLELRFPAGRYHATPWGRHVNEGVPEWPPSPFRMARALTDVWHRRCAENMPQEALVSALQIFAGTPRFSLPPSVQAAVKAYMPQYKSDSRQPVLDSFVALDSGAPLYMELQEASDEVLQILTQLLYKLDYLGRSESWVAARVIDTLPADRKWNCLPEAAPQGIDGEVSVNLLLCKDKYADLPIHPWRVKLVGKKKEQHPLGWFEALCLSTKNLFGDGWNRHPLTSPTIYSLSNTQIAMRRSLPNMRCVTYALHGPVLPPVTQTLPFAKRVRSILMGIHKRIMGGDEQHVSPMFSGKDATGAPLQGHKHACFWPLDLDGDGRIDHIRIHAAQEFSEKEQQTLFELRRVWTPGRGENLALTLVHALKNAPVEESKRFTSITPLVLQRHWRKGRGSYEDWLALEVRRACIQQNMPAPHDIIPLATRDDVMRWSAFARAENAYAGPSGYGFKLEFEEPVAGPFALGALAHYGLGLFVSVY